MQRLVRIFFVKPELVAGANPRNVKFRRKMTRKM